MSNLLHNQISIFINLIYIFCLELIGKSCYASMLAYRTLAFEGLKLASTKLKQGPMGISSAVEL